MAEEEMILEGGAHDGQPVPFAAMSHEGVGVYVPRDALGVYRHDEESVADFRDGQRLAVFEPDEPAPSDRHLRLVDGQEPPPPLSTREG